MFLILYIIISIITNIIINYNNDYYWQISYNYY